MTILIKGVALNGTKKDIYIKGNRIAAIEDNVDRRADTVLSGIGKAVIPSFVNGHTHAAMTLLRGYADDMPLQEWLEKKKKKDGRKFRIDVREDPALSICVNLGNESI